MKPGATAILHASTVAWGGRGLLILGASGAGKSSLALQLMAFGAGLVADDRTVVVRREGRLLASVPPPLAGLIEARGLGLLSAVPQGPVPLVLAVDLDHAEDQRLPPAREHQVLGCRIPLVRRVDHAAFPAAVLQYLKEGRSA
ncbi:HPr kinase/phosphorylase [Plastorhodobacter daqingensis]|uniref:HPr kinase/phosphorylase n=1 Tax=Plastorhodobacter daqingensis TaxID=1387281 RepID=A0ABW2UHR0_9RHOB